MRLRSYLGGSWVDGSGEGRPLLNPVTGEGLAAADDTGLDLEAALQHARQRGGASLAPLTFAGRGALLGRMAEVLKARRARYFEVSRLNLGTTERDAVLDIDGGIGTLRFYARLGARLGEARWILEPGQEPLTRDGSFSGRHLLTSRPGAAVQINAFNFPAWGLWEKVAVATLAGVPSVIKPATVTAWLAWEMVRDVVEAGVLPEGVLSLVCGRGVGLLEALGPMDSLAFTGSSEVGAALRRHSRVLEAGPRVNVEADSVNATVLGPDVAPGSPLFDLLVEEIVKALSVKAGQLCTNLRRVLVPAGREGAVAEAVVDRLAELKVGDPVDPQVEVGPLVSRAQQAAVLDKIGRLGQEARILAGGVAPERLEGGAGPAGAFVAPTLMVCEEPSGARLVHSVEPFGPCLTLMPYRGLEEAVSLVRRGEGALVCSAFTQDPGAAVELARALGPWHGRLLVVDEEVGAGHTGHATVMPQCVHGGPGRAGGGEELGGLRGLRFHLQRTAVQGSSALFSALGAEAVESALL